MTRLLLVLLAAAVALAVLVVVRPDLGLTGLVLMPALVIVAVGLTVAAFAERGSRW